MLSRLNEPQGSTSAPTASSFNSFPFSGGGAGRGGYAGGKRDRMTANWNPGSDGPNRMFQRDGRLLRERAWDLYNNNPFAASAIDAYISNVVESGLSPERDNEQWENAWERWGGLTVHATRECDLAGDCTINELQRLLLLEMLVGGGCLTHYVTVPRRSQWIPLALEMIGEERFADHVQQSGTNPKTSNPVQNGVEIDHLSGRTLAYHVYRTRPDDLAFDPLNTIRLPADQCEYLFAKERIGAKRGTTLMKSIVIWLWSLGYYVDNELKASDLKSSWAYMIKTDRDTGDVLLGPNGSCLTDSQGNPIDLHEQAMIWRGGQNDKIEGIGPNVPSGDSLPWLMMIQRSIAIGMRLSYEEVFRDFSKGSFASVRMARGTDVKRYRPLQGFLISHWGNPTVRRFDQAAVGAGIPGFPSPEEFANDPDAEWNNQEWQTPGWASPNPKDDAIANHQKLLDGTTSRTEICAAEGRSWKRTRKRLEREQRDIDEKGLKVTGATVIDPMSPNVETDGEPRDQEREE